MTLDADTLLALLGSTASLAEQSRQSSTVMSEMARQLERLLPQTNGYLLLLPLGERRPMVETFGAARPLRKAALGELFNIVADGKWEDGETMMPRELFSEGFAARTRFFGAVPIRTRIKCIGCILAASSGIGGTDRALALMRVFGELAGVHLENAQANEAVALKLRYLEEHDTLVTQLPNRRVFCARLRMTLEAGPAGLVFLDLDGFKRVNRDFGYSAGDRVLAEVARCWRAILQGENYDSMLARMGGDEFSVLLCGRDTGRAEAVANALIEALRAPHAFSDKSSLPTASAGISRAPENGNSVEDLLRCAEEAMFLAKAAGGDGYAVYDVLRIRD
jgi:diguanylate cyclase (GGDEF)-like protein